MLLNVQQLLATLEFFRQCMDEILVLVQRTKWRIVYVREIRAKMK